MRSLVVLLAVLAAAILAAGCLSSPAADGAASRPGQGAASGPLAGVDASLVKFVARTAKGACDGPLLPIGARPARSSEVMAATNPRNHDELAAVFKVPIPATRAQGPNDVELWDALARSTDGGKTWSLATLHGYPGDIAVHQPSLPFYGAAFMSDPVVAFAGDGTLVYAGLIARAESIDQFAAVFEPGQLEPSKVTLVARGDLRSIHGLEDLPAMTDQVPTPIAFIFNDGPHIGADPATNQVWLSWGVETVLDPEAVGPEQSRTTPAVSGSFDGGRTWTPMAFTAPDGRLGDFEGTNWGASRPLVDTLGRVHMFNRERYSKTIFDWVSADNGTTWAERVAVVSGLENDGGEGAYWGNTNPDPGVDRSNGPDHGSIYVTWSDTRNGDRDVFLTASRDGGLTWSEPLRLNDDPVGNGHDQFYPYMVVEPRTGAVNVLFMDRRADDTHETWSTAYIARSTDGGRSFVNIKIASEPTNTRRMINSLPNIPLSSYGDYNGITYNGDGLVPVWQDGRAGTDTTHYSDIFLCRIQTPPWGLV